MENLNVRYGIATDYNAVEEILMQAHLTNMEWRRGHYKPCPMIMAPEVFADRVEQQQVLVATVKKRVVGVLIFQFRHFSTYTTHSQDVLFISHLAVHKNFSTKLVLEPLLELAKQIGWNNKYPDIQLTFDSRNIKVYDLLLHMGFMEKSVLLEMRQGPGFP